VEDEPHGAP